MGEGLNVGKLVKQGIALQLIGSIILIVIIFSYHMQLNEMQDKFEEFKKLCDDSIYLISTSQNDIINDMSEEINQQTLYINSLEIDRTRLINELNLEYKNHNKIKVAYNQIKKDKGVINPTYQELKNFVNKDQTNRLKYNDDYVCSEFSYEFIRNFEMEGFSSGAVYLDLICPNEDDEEHGHAIVVINTTDRGIIYLEPQDDNLFSSENMQVNDNYCNIVDWDCDWVITKISSKYELKI